MNLLYVKNTHSALLKAVPLWFVDHAYRIPIKFRALAIYRFGEHRQKIRIPSVIAVAVCHLDFSNRSKLHILQSEPPKAFRC